MRDKAYGWPMARRGVAEHLDWAMSTLQSARTCELLLKAHYNNGCTRGKECPVVSSLERRIKKLRST